MTQSFKFRFVNEIVGLFVLAILASVVFGVVWAGKSQGWFEPKRELSLVLPQEGSFGLREGAEVRMLETPFGTVRDIIINEDGSMEARLLVKGDFTQFIRTDSWAILKKVLAVTGDTYVEITRGAGDPLPDNTPIPCMTDTDLVKQLQGMVTEVRLGASEAMDRIKALLEEHTALASDLRDPEGRMQMLLAHMGTVTEGLAEGEGTVGRLLRDPTLANELEALVGELKKAVSEVGVVLANLQATVEKFPDMAEAVSEKLDDVPQLILQAELTLHEAEQLLQGLQRHWLVRKYIEAPDATGRIPAGGGP